MFRIGDNMRGYMHGVVLWCDRDQDRAVIWCDDHGDLAYYRGDGSSLETRPDLAPGDLVKFELSEGGDVRLACRPRLVAQKTHPSLTSALKQAGRNAGAFPGNGPKEAAQGNVLPFAPQRCSEVA